jgi:hypothetical protein
MRRASLEKGVSEFPCEGVGGGGLEAVVDLMSATISHIRTLLNLYMSVRAPG